MLDTLKNWAVLTHQLERLITESAILRVNIEFAAKSDYRFKSARLQIACNEIEKARMVVNDLVRLSVLGAKSRENTRFIPADHGCCYTPDLTNLFDLIYVDPQLYAEDILIDYIKKTIRNLLYDTFSYDSVSYYPHVNGDSDFHGAEFLFYAKRYQIALYDCDRALGLRLGELAHTLTSHPT